LSVLKRATGARDNGDTALNWLETPAHGVTLNREGKLTAHRPAADRPVGHPYERDVASSQRQQTILSLLGRVHRAPPSADQYCDDCVRQPPAPGRSPDDSCREEQHGRDNQRIQAGEPKTRRDTDQPGNAEYNCRHRKATGRSISLDLTLRA
jgi:hypothetical protein